MIWIVLGPLLVLLGALLAVAFGVAALLLWRKRG